MDPTKIERSRSSEGHRRREFLALPLTAGAARGLSAAPLKDENDADNLKIATGLNVHSATDNDLLALKQIGLRWVHAQFGNNGSYEAIKSAQERLALYGIKIHCGIVETYRSIKIQLGQPGRDEEIERFQTFLGDLGRLGIPVAHIDFHPGNTYTTNTIESPRGYKVREFNLEDFRKKVEKPRFERQYSAEEIWANYTYFLKAVVPVAEKANVRLAHHPDDPPLAMMNGVAKVFIDYDGYRHAEQIAGSNNWGLCLCVGTWAEGGDKMGKDVFGMIRDFGGRGKIFTIHFRNVSSPLPRFYETFPDDGYLDMYQVIKALRQVRFTGTIIPDHYPGLVNDAGHRVADTYSLTYMRALLRRANEEVG
jgi:mannonate dehydratase